MGLCNPAFAQFLGKAIEDAIRTIDTESSEERVVDVAQCIDRMGNLMAYLSGNAKFPSYCRRR